MTFLSLPRAKVPSGGKGASELRVEEEEGVLKVGSLLRSLPTAGCQSKTGTGRMDLGLSKQRLPPTLSYTHMYTHMHTRASELPRQTPLSASGSHTQWLQEGTREQGE